MSCLSSKANVILIVLDNPSLAVYEYSSIERTKSLVARAARIKDSSVWWINLLGFGTVLTIGFLIVWYFLKRTIPQQR